MLKKEVVKSLKFSFKLVFECSRKLTLLNLGVMLVQSVFPLLSVFLVKELIDEVTLVQNENAALSKVLVIVVFTGLVFFLNALAESLKQYINQIQGQQFYDFIYSIVHKKTTSVNIEYFENEEYYNLFSRTLSNADKRPLEIVNNTFSFLHHGLSIVTLGVLILTLHWSVFFLLLFAALPLGLVQWRNTNKLYKWYRAQTKSERKSWDINDILTNAYFATEVRLFNLSGFLTKTFSTIRSNIKKGVFGLCRQILYLESTAQFFAAILVFGVLGLLSVQAVQGQMTVGVLAMFVIAIQKGVSLFLDLFKNAARVYENSLYVTYFIDFLTLENKVTENETGLAFPQPLIQGIELKNVNFSYPKNHKKVLHDINIKIPVNSTIALVGANGSGKSTLVKLLCHLYEVDSGEILIDGTNINQFKDSDIRQNISALFQNYCRYNLTASENIWIGDTNKPQTAETIKLAAEKAHIHPLIEKLNNGYDTVLGKIYDNSQEISVGEWQKISLARAFFKNSQILFLDEPSSAMDPETEHKIFELFKEITRDKTSVIVSHRLSTIKMADYIYVLDQGRIVEIGTHCQLMEKGGTYHSMYSKQSNSYFEAGLQETV